MATPLRSGTQALDPVVLRVVAMVPVILVVLALLVITLVTMTSPSSASRVLVPCGATGVKRKHLGEWDCDELFLTM